MPGADAALSRLRDMLDSGVNSATTVAEAMANVVARGVEEELGKSSHAPGTPTPSAPGTPPAMITGTLRSSVEVRYAGPGAFQVGATAVYARIHQFGGYSGWNRATRTPERPYLGTALDASLREAGDVGIDLFIAWVYGE